MTSSAPGALVFTVSGERPGYLAEVVASWRRVRGVEAWPVTFLVEPGTRVPECRTVIADAFPDATVVVHPERQGVRANPHRALATAYDACLAMLRGFRDKHIQMVSRYIVLKSRESRSHSRSISPKEQRLNLANTVSPRGCAELTRGILQTIASSPSLENVTVARPG